MKKLFIIIAIFPFLSLISCGKNTLDSKEDAITFLESNNFFDESASVKGKSSDASISTSFSLSFSGGMAQIGEESLPYTISDLIENGNAPTYMANTFNGYEIEICGSERYAYGGCIKCYIDAGFNSENGPSLSVKGDYINAYFSYISEGSIVEK